MISIYYLCSSSLVGLGDMWMTVLLPHNYNLAAQHPIYGGVLLIHVSTICE
jgi:hypothetical protein